MIFFLIFASFAVLLAAHALIAAMFPQLGRILSNLFFILVGVGGYVWCAVILGAAAMVIKELMRP